MDQLKLKKWFVCRDTYNDLKAYDKKPLKRDTEGVWEARKNSLEIILPEECFPEIQFENGYTEVEIIINKIKNE